MLVYDHVSSRNVRGISLLNALYHVDGRSVPVAFELIKKPVQYCDVRTRQVKRMSVVTKNELMRAMLQTCVNNDLKFRHVVMDSWFSARENFEFIVKKSKHFAAALKSNRRVSVSAAGQKSRRFTRVDELKFPKNGVVCGHIKDFFQEVVLVRQVFTNKEGSTATLYLACSDLTCDYNAITATYKKRWAVEVFHKSLKSNANLAKSPIRTIRAQSNHVFMSFYAAFKLECLSSKKKLNPFALCRKLLIINPAHKY